MEYNVHMKVNATEFRKNLFQLLEQARGGDAVEVSYKGSELRLTAVGSGSKLARAKRQHAIVGDPRALASSDGELMAEFEREWEKDWKEL
jgi:antitoxin (DNA-binding transcriptional repressor) of toxin-antitoxin stability system